MTVDFDPSRPMRIRPLRASSGWTPGDEHRAPDAVLGAVVAVPGEAGRFTLAIPDAEQPRTGLALSAWVRWGGQIPGAGDDPTGDPIDAPADATAPVVAVHLTRQRAGRTRIDVVLGAERFHATVDLDAPAAAPTASGPALDAGQWHQLAVLWDGPSRTASLLVDGAVRASHPTTVDHLPFRRAARVEIVKERRGIRRLLVGPVRLHSMLRTPAELLSERLADLAAHPTTDEGAPLGFRLSDAADEPTLSITDDDAPGRALHVVLENRSEFPVALPRATAPRDERLELRFRPGALAGDAHHWVDPGSPRWQVEPIIRDDGGVSLYLAPAEPLSLAPGRAVAISLDHVRAAGDAGSHGTHVELCYPHPHHPGLRSARVSVARVVGRRGRRRSPLRFGIAGDPTVHNDGIAGNTLRCYVANSSVSRPVRLLAPVDGVGTTFVLSFDAGEPGDPWALATTDQLLAAQVSVEPVDWRIEVESQDEAPEWILTPTRDQVLGPSERIEIVIEELITGPGPAGRTRASLRLENVPGYWDDGRTVDVEKSRVLRDREPAALQVHGEIHDRWGELLPPGTIVLWHGYVEDIPPGWVLCDQHNGTPNLVGRFVRGADPRRPVPPDAPAPTRTGGVDPVPLTGGHLRLHRHDVDIATESHHHQVDVVSPDKATFVGGATVKAALELPDPVRPAITALRGLESVPFGFGTIFLAMVNTMLLMHDATKREFKAIADAATVQAYVPRADGETKEVPTGSTGVRVRGPTVDNGALVDVTPAYYELCYIMKRFLPKSGTPKPAPEVHR